jgi:hypothetical protein
MVAAVAVKEPVDNPAFTVTFAGTERLALLLLSETATPPVGAVPVSVTVQAVLPGVLMVVGEHNRELRRTG